MVELKHKTLSFLAKCKRVWVLLKKPTAAEFKTVSKVAAIGLGAVGLIGFTIAILMNLVLPN